MMKPAKVLRRARSVGRNAWQSHRLASASTRRRFTTGPGPDAAGPHVLVAPPGGGNIGDQAMVESFLENTSGDVVLVQRGDGDIHVPPSSGRVTTVSLPTLIYGTGADRARDLARYGELVGGAASVNVVGADMMDGKYSVAGSARRILLAELAALRGVPTRILGFSWNASPHPSAVRALTAASEAGVVPLLRDPLSAERARRDGVRGVVETTDLVFAARSTDDSTTREVRALTGTAPYVVVNASALVARGLDQVAEYVHLVDALRENGFHIVLLPHVLRGSSNDLAAVEAVAAAVGTDGVHLLADQLSPAQVRGLAGAASFVVTGRMHLAIMAMWGGVPAVTFSTQGKVDGLMRRFGVPQLSVEPGVGMGRVVTELFPTLHPGGPVATAIADQLPSARDAAAANFPGNP